MPMLEREHDRIRVLVADDHRMARAGLCMLLRLEPDIEVVGEANDGYEALVMAADLQPDVLVADVSMPGPGGVELARQLKDDQPTVRVVVLTMHEDLNLAREAKTAGAAGYIVKRAAESELIAAIRSPAGGSFYIDSGVQAPCDEVARPKEGSEARTRGTSAVEAQLLRLLAQGLSMSQVARVMDTDTGAAEELRQAMMNRLHLHSRIDIMRYVRDHDLLENKGE